MHPRGVESLAAEEIRRAVALALAEDIGSGDVTTLAAVPETARAKAVVRAREPLVVAGLALAEAAFRELSPDVQVTRATEDGQRVAEGKPLLRSPARPALCLAPNASPSTSCSASAASPR